MTAADVIEKARSYRNVPFSHQGRSRHGVDCVGLVVKALEEAGYTPEHPDTFQERNYRRVPDPARLFACLTGEAKELLSSSMFDSQVEFLSRLEETARPGDLLLMAYRSDHNVPRHMALVCGTNPLRVIHTNNELAKVSEHTVYPDYSQCVTSLWRLRYFCHE